MERRGQCVDVRRCARGPPFNDLRRRVRECGRHLDRGRLVAVGDSAYAEVRDHRLPVVGQQDVLRLYVAVHDAALVSDRKGACDRNSNVHHVDDGDLTTCPERAGYRSRRKERHQQVRRARRGHTRSDYGHDVRVTAKRAENGCFTSESRHVGGVGSRDKDLQCKLSTQQGLLHAVHHTHAAPAYLDRIEEAVNPERRRAERGRREPWREVSHEQSESEVADRRGALRRDAVLRSRVGCGVDRRRG